MSSHVIILNSWLTKLALNILLNKLQFIASLDQSNDN